MNTEHTPGPWTIQHGASPRVYLVNGPKGQAVGEVVYSDTRNPSDAQLIAAAPELLDALKTCESVLRIKGYANAAEIAQNAIYKAIGA